MPGRHGGLPLRDWGGTRRVVRSYDTAGVAEREGAGGTGGSSVRGLAIHGGRLRLHDAESEVAAVKVALVDLDRDPAAS